MIPDTIQNEIEGTAFLAKNRKTEIKSQNKIRKCFNCGKPGHFAAKCRFKNKSKENKNSSNPKAFIAMAAIDNTKENY